LVIGRAGGIDRARDEELLDRTAAALFASGLLMRAVSVPASGKRRAGVMSARSVSQP
jgi:hypothetical protein